MLLMLGPPIRHITRHPRNVRCKVWRVIYLKAFDWFYHVYRFVSSPREWFLIQATTTVNNTHLFEDRLFKVYCLDIQYIFKG
jgi:hypothetical protein